MPDRDTLVYAASTDSEFVHLVWRRDHDDLRELRFLMIADLGLDSAAGFRVLGGVGFWIVGLPGLVWGPLIGVSSFIPIVGTARVTVPAVAYLVVEQMYWQAIFFAVWAAVLVGGVDNYLRLFLMRGQARMSPFHIFPAIIGRLSTFGLSSLISGPLVVAIAIVVVDVYRQEQQSPAGERRLMMHSPGNRRLGWQSRRALCRSRD